MQKNSLQCRKALLSDDVESIAKYLHLTDPYIYPRICKNPVDKKWVDFVRSCMKKENNIFNVQNLSVILNDDKIVGVMCVIPCGKSLNFIEIGDGISKDFSDKLNPVASGYFNPLIAESVSYDGHNLVSICIDADYRRKGLGKLFMTHCMSEYGFQPVHLDVVASNTHAVNLYKHFGFEITKEYYGYSGDETKLLCYHMIRMPEK